MPSTDSISQNVGHLTSDLNRCHPLTNSVNDFKNDDDFEHDRSADDSSPVWRMNEEAVQTCRVPLTNICTDAQQEALHPDFNSSDPRSRIDAHVYGAHDGHGGDRYVDRKSLSGESNRLVPSQYSHQTYYPLNEAYDDLQPSYIDGLPEAAASSSNLCFESTKPLLDIHSLPVQQNEFEYQDHSYQTVSGSMELRRWESKFDDCRTQCMPYIPGFNANNVCESSKNERFRYTATSHMAGPPLTTMVEHKDVLNQKEALREEHKQQTEIEKELQDKYLIQGRPVP